MRRVGIRLGIIIVTLILWVFPVSGEEWEAVEVWTARYNYQGTSHDEPTCMALGEDGSIYVGGYSWLFYYSYDYLLIKYDNDGNQLWVRRYDGSAGTDDWIYDIALDEDGNVIVTGSAGITDHSWDFVTIKYDAEGNELWTAEYNGTGGLADMIPSLAVDPAGNVYITGESWADTVSKKDIATIKYDAQGNELWAVRYDALGMGDWSNDIAVDADGNVYVTGTSAPEDGSYDIVTIKYDTGGNEAWVVLYDGSMEDTDIGRSVAVDDQGYVYVTGSVLETGEYFDYVTIKYDNQGNEIWARTYGDPFHSGDLPTKVTFNSSGDVYVAGTNMNYYGTNYLTVKYDADGFEQWTAQYNGTAIYDIDEVYDMTLDGDGNIYVTGMSQGDSTQKDYATVKYTPDGDEVWVARYDASMRYDYSVALAVDDDGYIYVTGHSIAADSTWTDFLTIKYDEVQVGIMPENPSTLPCVFQVSSYPNPFNPATVFSYNMQVAGHVNLAVYDVHGRRVAELINGWRGAGHNEVTFDGSELPSGIYFYRLMAGEFSDAGKMVLLK